MMPLTRRKAKSKVHLDGVVLLCTMAGSKIALVTFTASPASGCHAKLGVIYQINLIIASRI